MEFLSQIRDKITDLKQSFCQKANIIRGQDETADLEEQKDAWSAAKVLSAGTLLVGLAMFVKSAHVGFTSPVGDMTPLAYSLDGFAVGMAGLFGAAKSSGEYSEIVSEQEAIAHEEYIDRVHGGVEPEDAIPV